MFNINSKVSNLFKTLIFSGLGVFVFLLFSISENVSADSWLKDVPSVVLNDVNDTITRFKLSDLSSTGLYVSAGDIITVRGDDVVICLGPPGNFEDRKNSQISETLVKGEKTITNIDNNSVIYIRNNSGKIQNVSIKGARKFPLFEAGVTRSSDFYTELKNNPHVPFIEFSGKNSILTIPNPINFVAELKKISSSENIIGTQNLNGFEGFTEYFDKVAVYGAEMSGLHFDNVNKSSLNSISGKIHYVKADENVSSGIFNASDYRVSLHTTKNFKDILNEFINNPSSSPMMNGIWGLWHEVGHLFQNNYMIWNGMSEVTVNINSIYTLKKMGHSINELGDFKNVASSIVTYLGSDDSNKDFNKNDVFFKLGMFAQLMDAYGDDIFAKLNQEYRNALHSGNLKTASKYSDDEKQQMFMSYLSKTTKRDLSGFFKKWGLYANDETMVLMKTFSQPSVPIENNIFVSNEKPDGDIINFSSLLVDVKSVDFSKVQQGINTLVEKDLFDSQTLRSYSDNKKIL